MRSSTASEHPLCVRVVSVRCDRTVKKLACYHTLAKFVSNALESVKFTTLGAPLGATLLYIYIYTQGKFILSELLKFHHDSRCAVLPEWLYSRIGCLSLYKQCFYAFRLGSVLKGMISLQPFKITVCKCNKMKVEAIVPEYNILTSMSILLSSALLY